VIKEILHSLGSGWTTPEREVGTTALHAAYDGGYLEVVWELLNHGADLNKGKLDGSTLLHRAIRTGR
jgi:ankyrin repeat protein